MCIVADKIEKNRIRGEKVTEKIFKVYTFSLPLPLIRGFLYLAQFPPLFKNTLNLNKVFFLDFSVCQLRCA